MRLLKIYFWRRSGFRSVYRNRDLSAYAVFVYAQLKFQFNLVDPDLLLIHSRVVIEIRIREFKIYSFVCYLFLLLWHAVFSN